MSHNSIPFRFRALVLQCQPILGSGIQRNMGILHYTVFGRCVVLHYLLVFCKNVSGAKDRYLQTDRTYVFSIARIFYCRCDFDCRVCNLVPWLGQIESYGIYCCIWITNDDNGFQYLCAQSLVCPL